METQETLIFIGENMHTTRVIARGGKHVHGKHGDEAILFMSVEGVAERLPIPESFKTSPDYDQGRIKHVQIALQTAMEGGTYAEIGRAYLRRLVRDQERAGAHMLDINVDEFSLADQEREAAMAWAVRMVQAVSSLPIAVDSSNVEVLGAGLAAWDRSKGRALLNSASLQRPEALDLAAHHGARVIVTAMGEDTLPQDPEERLAKGDHMIARAFAKGFAADDIFIDPLYLPLVTDAANGLHSLAAIHHFRERYGPEIHITGGIGNVSYGLPARRLVNDVFLSLTMDAGADSGLIDPVLNPPREIAAIDRHSDSYRLAENLLLGRDAHCEIFRRAAAKGGLVSWKAAP